MTKSEIVSICEQLIAVPYCCAELKEIGRAWIDSIGTADEQDAAAALIAELTEDICTIDDAIGFFSSPKAEEFMGAEAAKAKLESVLKEKEDGALYCGCEACTLGVKLLEAKDIILGQ